MAIKMTGFLKKFLRRIYLLLVYLVVYKKKCNSLQLQIFNYVSSWYPISWSRPPPAKWFIVFCSGADLRITKEVPEALLSRCHKLNDRGALKRPNKNNELQFVKNRYEEKLYANFIWELCCHTNFEIYDSHAGLKN